ncbi:MAG: hypothetical protein J5801_05915 [Bacteroidales bacterium]|nr:hypothetical protein [Bacteroidales bacterium]
MEPGAGELLAVDIDVNEVFAAYCYLACLSVQDFVPADAASDVVATAIEGK